MRKGVFNAAATDTKSETSRFLGLIVHTGPQRSYSGPRETDHLRLIELPAHVMVRKKNQNTPESRVFTYVYPGSQSKRLFWLVHTGSTVQGSDIQMHFCPVGRNVNERLGARDCGKSFSLIGPALLTVIPSTWVACSTLMVTGCMAA